MTLRVLSVAVAALALASPAVAKPTPEADVEAVLKSTLDHVADSASTANLAKGAIVIGIHANVFDVDTLQLLRGQHAEETIDYKTHGALWPMLFGHAEPKGTRKLGKVSVIADGDKAWFAAPYDVNKDSMHVTGLAVKQNGTWTLQVLSASLVMPDSEGDKHIVLAPKIAWSAASPPSAVGKAIVSWFTTKTLAKHAAGTAVLAGGSAPSELKSGKDAIAFAALLDKLDLIPVFVEGDDKTAVITGTAWLPKLKDDDRDGRRVRLLGLRGQRRWRVEVEGHLLRERPDPAVGSVGPGRRSTRRRRGLARGRAHATRARPARGRRRHSRSTARCRRG